MEIIKHINIANKVATYDKSEGKIVCANSNYVAEFTFDEEWNAYEKKKAHFAVKHRGLDKHIDIEFSGNQCPIPPFMNVTFVEIGVFIDGGISTTTPAKVECERSALCGTSHAVLPNEFIVSMNEALRGKDGKSAYEIAVDYGFEGTEEEWLQSLKGAPGKNGENYVLTETDKTDIANMVLNLIPNGDEVSY